MQRHETREAWLAEAIELICGQFEAFQTGDFAGVRVACGWPRQKRGRGGRGADTIGQYWAGSTTADGRAQIFISPRLDATAALETLLHEMVHHKAGVAAGHKGRFATLAASVGLLEPWHETPASPVTKTVLSNLLPILGSYPHGTIAVQALEPKKQGSRLRLWECACPKPVKVRVASDTFSALCLVCGSDFKQPGTDESEPDE